MSAGYRCDRCGAFGMAEIDNHKEATLPTNWRAIHGPVRGSAGARSIRTYHLCDRCDDSLYEWLTRDGTP